MKRWMLAAAAAAAGLWGAPAQAAPQMLGLVATNVAQPMTCDGTVCAVELSAFCLQRDRHDPAPGTPYDATDPRHIVLEVDTAAGTERVTVGGMAEIVSARGQFAVAVRLPRQAVEALGANPRIVVAPMAALVPEPVPGDPEPLTEAEIARATGPLRHLAGAIAEGATSDGNTARVLARIINAMPEGDPVPAGRLAALWEHGLEAIGGDPDALGAHPAAEQLANCQYAPSAGMSVKACLQQQHDRAIGEMNIDIWTLTGAGS